MSLRQQFGTDTKKETEGVKVKYPANADGSIPTFEIARMGKANKAYSRALETATRPYRVQIQSGRMDNDVAETIFADVFARTVLKGWQNVTLADVTGNKDAEGMAPFSRENALKLFEALPELYEDLQERAKSAATFLEDVREEEAGN